MWSQCSHQSGLQCLSSLLHTLYCKCEDNDYHLKIMPLYLLTLYNTPESRMARSCCQCLSEAQWSCNLPSAGGHQGSASSRGHTNFAAAGGLWSSPRQSGRRRWRDHHFHRTPPPRPGCGPTWCRVEGALCKEGGYQRW